MIPGDFDYQLSLQKQLISCLNVRAVVDTVLDLDLFVYPFLAGDLLRLTRRCLPREMKICILRCALRGLADLHERGILHNGEFRGLLVLIFKTSLTGTRYQSQ